MAVVDAGAPSPPEAPNANGSSPGNGPRLIRRRRGLPNSRALIGGVLVAAAAVGLFAAYLSVAAEPDQVYVVARSRLAPGAPLRASDLALERMELPPALRARAFDRVAALEGATVLAPLEPGELVQAGAVVASGGQPAIRELSFPIDRAHLGAGLREGERVDILATFGTGEEAVTASVLRQALVVGLQTDKSTLANGGAVVITVAVEDQAAEMALAHAVQ
ncbi:MAG: SAF domain-containing protein, partial [Actinomycetota bacterium]|nr:SAF domain-containing protein [Actinomycetota bacterium]